ncbi:hypothetical protein BWQ96_07344 [Gracilariopsis chorda]|uniref:C2H2-type domain-containing protein n=1 Tax=Gracilariopsis chorda TaxID=448386 RepID=A0A2V3ILH2_9FLOR|nr:hypothetical protein BWQ96_07344 [Gracilariopsis chorda]|eukprot:PXF42897.1 hypothetical protein BWQ96_07344 [Gracilariopsis chorda]
MHPNAHVGGFSTPSTTATEAHTGGPTFQCHYEDCMRIFRRKTSLTNHLKAHKNINSRSINRSKRARRRSELLRQAAEATTSIARTHQSALTTAVSASTTSTSGQTFLDQTPTPLTLNYQLEYSDTRETEPRTSPNDIVLPPGFQIGPECLAAHQQPAGPNIALPWVEIDGVQSDPLAYSTNTIPTFGQVDSSAVDVNWWGDGFLNPFGSLHEEGQPLLLTSECGYDLSPEEEPLFPQPTALPKQEDDLNPVNPEEHGLIDRTSEYGANL